MDKTGLEKLKAGDEVYVKHGFGMHATVPTKGKVIRVTKTRLIVSIDTGADIEFYHTPPKNIHYGLDRWIGRAVGSDSSMYPSYVFPVTEANTAEVAERQKQYDLDQAIKLIRDHISAPMFRHAGWEAIHQICNLLPDLKEVPRIKALLDQYPVADPSEAQQIAHLEQEKNVLLDMLKQTDELKKLLDSFGVKMVAPAPATPYEGSIPRPTKVVRVSAHSTIQEAIAGAKGEDAILIPPGEWSEQSVNSVDSTPLSDADYAAELDKTIKALDDAVSGIYGGSEVTDPDKAQDTDDTSNTN